MKINFRCCVNKKKNTVDKQLHGVKENQPQLYADIAWLDPEDKWKNLSGIGMLTNTQQNIGSDEVHSAVHYLIFSIHNANAEQILSAKREHWSIENHLHWHLDVTFGEDSSKVHNKKAAGVWNVFVSSL